jgi:hypothetical protein
MNENEVATVELTPTQDIILPRVEYFNRRALRRLYNSGGSGRGVTGTKNRYKMSLMLTPATHDKLGETVQLGKGSYGAPTIELAIRVLLALVGQVELQEVADELNASVIDTDKVMSNLADLTFRLANK